MTTLWSTEAVAALTLAVLYGVVWSRDRRNLASLTLCMVAIAMAVVARVEVGMMQSATAAEYGEWARSLYPAAFLALIGQVLFVHLFLGTGRRWLLLTIVGARVVVLVGDFLTYPTFTKSAGLGMGLPISRTIIEAHGGRLWAERARDGGGLTFRFTLSQAQGAVS